MTMFVLPCHKLLINYAYKLLINEQRRKPELLFATSNGNMTVAFLTSVHVHGTVTAYLSVRFRLYDIINHHY